MNISRIELEVFTDNAPAIALYTKCGFVTEGTCRQYAYRDGEQVDVHIMARIRDVPGRS
jgi:putative acetyltransferase